MIIQPRVRGFICTTAHPDGLFAEVKAAGDYAKKAIGGKPIKYKNALIIGASMGYGLAARVALGLGAGASTVGVIFDRPASGTRTASAGWYNTAAFAALAKENGLKSATVNGDAFSYETKERTLRAVKDTLGKADLVIYSLAAPKRADGETVYSSVLKTIGRPFTQKTVDLKSGAVETATVLPATPDEIAATIKVMGGEDWLSWINFLKENDALSDDAVTVAFSYIGPKLTHAIYTDGTIGAAKRHLKDTADVIKDEGIPAFVSVNKALVTQSSAAIPVVPLYIGLLYKVMKEKGVHEDCIAQMTRLIRDKLSDGIETDGDGFIRLDELEMRDDVQQEVAAAFEKVTTENLGSLSDTAGYESDFLKIFGFGLDGVDYEKDVDPERAIGDIVED